MNSLKKIAFFCIVSGASSLFWPGTVGAQTVVVARADCLALTEHVPDSGVAYKPGVDVRGNSVVAADVDGGAPITLPETIEISIGIDLADRLGRKRDGDSTVRPVLPYEGKAPLGTLSVRGQQAFWNGEPLNRQDTAAVAEACRKNAPK